MCRAVLSDLDEPVREVGSLLTTYPLHRSRTASVMAAVMLSPVNFARALVSLWVSSFLMFKAIRYTFLP